MNENLTEILDTLNDPARLKEMDPQGMLRLAIQFPQQCQEAVGIRWQNTEAKSDAPEIRNVVVTGMGGSAIGGEFARALVEEYGSVPLIVNRDYTLPHWVDAHTLVITMSYSGGTEETLAAFAEAKSKGAQIAVITSGGKILEMAKADGLPHAIVPGGQPPRSALGFMFFPLFRFLAAKGLLGQEHDFSLDVEEALDLLDMKATAYSPSIPTAHNPAKQLALDLYGKIPVIYGSQGYRGVVATRWKGQFNENGKLAAFANVLPEQNHNEILSWTNAEKQSANFSIIFLRDPDETARLPRIAKRVQVTKEIIGDAYPIYEAVAEGDSMLERMMSLVTLADYVTIYLALLDGTDPTTIAGIDRLKEELSKV
ncbi:MAG: bifunctional phosphoglucose/phosphomannose isomerase [Chthonomonadaceae bacterium]|nr:bifunctional phosphoglucose/phosphomannose isomerase [Chthonomonadaceae bacterium]